MDERYAGEKGSTRVNASFSAEGENAVEVLFQEEQITVDQATTMLEEQDKSENPSDRWLYLVYETLSKEGLIDRVGEGKLFRARRQKEYAVNGSSKDEVIDYVETYRQHHL